MIQGRINFYRLHFIDRRTGAIGHTYDFHAESDEAAIKFAEVWSEDAPMELWGRRRVRRWDPSANDR